jgi:hypothetical protein
MTCSTSELPIADWPLWWFAKLSRGIETSDLKKVSEAQQQLLRLGIVVNVRLLAPKPAGGKR